LRLRKFSAIILLNISCIHLACNSFSSMPMIHRFGLLMESLSCWVFFLQLLNFFLSKNSSVFSLISSLSSSPEICLPLVLVCWSGFPLYFLPDLRNFLFPGFLFDSSFSKVFLIFVQLLFHKLCCLFSYIFVFIVSFVSLSSLLKSSLSSWVHLVVSVSSQIFIWVVLIFILCVYPVCSV
jgi:hypothetical protein